VPIDIEGGYARLIAARQLLLDVRQARSETLQRLRSYARAQLVRFMGTTDPVTGARLLDISAEGNKQNGDLAITMAFFDGSKLVVAVDRSGHYSGAVTPAHAVPDFGRVLDVRVAADDSSAQIVCEPPHAPGTEHVFEVLDLVALLLDNTVAVLEAEVPVIAPEPAPETAGRLPNAA